MIIRWCNDDSTITGSESCASSSSNIDETQSNTSSMTNSSLSSCETDLHLSKTERMEKRQKKRHKKKKDKKKKDRKKEDKRKPLPEVVAKDTSKSSTNINKEKDNDNLITLDDSVANSSANMDNGIPLDKFQNELFQSSHQYLPT